MCVPSAFSAKRCGRSLAAAIAARLRLPVVTTVRVVERLAHQKQPESQRLRERRGEQWVNRSAL